MQWCEGTVLGGMLKVFLKSVEQHTRLGPSRTGSGASVFPLTPKVTLCSAAINFVL